MSESCTVLAYATRFVASTMVGMTSPTREEIALAIDTATGRCPLIPDSLPDTGAELAYVVARVRELIVIWRTNGLEPVHAAITCSLAIAATIGSIDAVDGVPVSVIGDPYGADNTEAGTFWVDIDADHPASIWVRPARGFAFATPVDPSYLATRWVLEETDGMSPSDASRAADSL